MGFEGRMWKAIRDVIGGKSFVIIYKGCCVLQAGLASGIEGEAKIVNSLELMQGSLCRTVLNSGKRKDPDSSSAPEFSLFFLINSLSFLYFSKIS